MSTQKAGVSLYRPYIGDTPIHLEKNNPPSIKALANKYLTATNPMRQCITELGAGDTPTKRDTGTPGKIFNVTLPTLEYAKAQLIPCHLAGGKLAHLWACAALDCNKTCPACQGREAELKEWLLYDFPHSLALTEGMFEVERDNPLYPMVAACPDFYKGCFSCRHCDFSKEAFCGKYSMAGMLLS